VFISCDVVFEEGLPHRTSASVGEQIPLFDMDIVQTSLAPSMMNPSLAPILLIKSLASMTSITSPIIIHPLAPPLSLLSLVAPLGHLSLQRQVPSLWNTKRVNLLERERYRSGKLTIDDPMPPSPLIILKTTTMLPHALLIQRHHTSSPDHTEKP
jgi:hypothetical protein